MSTRVKRGLVGILMLQSMAATPSSVTAAPATADASGSERMIVLARSDAVYDQLRQDVQRAGGRVVDELRSGGMLVVRGSTGLKNQLKANGSARAVATDRIETLPPQRGVPETSTAPAARKAHARTVVDSATSAAVGAASGQAERSVDDDPAFAYPGLMWSIDRIRAPEAWRVTTGEPEVRVGVADTGLDFTHTDLKSRIAEVVDLTTSEDPPICKSLYPNPIDTSQPGVGDADLASMLHGPVTTDWNGHGSWIGGNIAGALNGRGVNGIAPNVKLVSLKISQWCGAAYDSEILHSILYAADHHIDIVNISLTNYFDPADPDQLATYIAYAETVQYARSKGTLIVAAAGNDHVQISRGGLVTSHGQLSEPGAPSGDLFGSLESPGGVPGVIDVSATVNVVVPSSAACAPGSIGSLGGPSATSAFSFAECKPKQDPHQAAGQGKLNQLAYYSNYGPRIDVAGPGGANKFNLPFIDRGGSPGFPYTSDDLTTAYGDFSTTSNWGLDLQCFTFTGGGFPKDQCYATQEGTSMAAPHASGVLALLASTQREGRANPNRLEQLLKSSAHQITGNKTRVLNPTDTSPGDLTGAACPGGYCHLGGAAISDAEAYGAGLVDAQRAVGPSGADWRDADTEDD